LDVVQCFWVSSEISKDWRAFILSIQHTYVTHLTSHTGTLLALFDPKIKALWSPSNNTVLYTKRLIMYCAIFLTAYWHTYIYWKTIQNVNMQRSCLFLCKIWGFHQDVCLGYGPVGCDIM
jgi:hypothetical protein